MIRAWASGCEASQSPTLRNCLVRKTAPNTLGWTPLGTEMCFLMSLIETSPCCLQICTARFRQSARNSGSRCSKMSSWTFLACWPGVASSMVTPLCNQFSQGHPAKSAPSELDIGCARGSVLATLRKCFCGVSDFLHIRKPQNHKNTKAGKQCQS